MLRLVRLCLLQRLFRENVFDSHAANGCCLELFATSRSRSHPNLIRCWSLNSTVVFGKCTGIEAECILSGGCFHPRFRLKLLYLYCFSEDTSITPQVTKQPSAIKCVSVNFVYTMIASEQYICHTYIENTEIQSCK